MLSTTEHSDVTEKLARFVAATGWDDIPERARHEARRAIVNIFATAFAGCREQPIEIALKSLQEFSDRQQATVIGRTERVDTLSGAFLNAASANVFDFCDTHLATVMHPTAPLAPALFALAEQRRISGRQLILAFVLGYEIECRVGLAISPGHYGRGWHITSTCGVFGAATGAGKLLGLDARQLVGAIGNAAGQSSGLVENVGTPAKSISVGNAARNGLWSALLAERGFNGPDRPIEGGQGYLSAMGEEPDWSAFTRGIGETWEVLANACKPYPCGIVIHPVLDAVLDLRGSPGFAPETIDRITVRGHPLLAKRTDRPDVATGREAQVSVQHSVAVACLFGRPGLEHYTDACVRDPAVLDLRRKVEVVRDPSIAVEGAVVTVRMRDGRELGRTVDFAVGSAQRPMSDDDLAAKLLTYAAARLPGDAIRRLIDAIWTLDRRDDAGSLMRLTVPNA